MKKRLKTLFIIITLLATPLFADWSKSVSINSGYDNNAFRNYKESPDFVTHFSGYIAKTLNSANWSLRGFYRGNLRVFKNFNERNFHYHMAGASWARDLSKNGSSLNLGFNGSVRKNDKIYSYYNLIDAAGFANFKIKFNPSNSLVLGYRIRGRWYTYLSEMDNTEHKLFTRYTHFFQTRTTLILEGNFGRKIYSWPASSNIENNWNDQWDIGHYDHHNADNWQDHGGGMWSGSNWGNEQTAALSGSSINQWMGKIRIAQSLGMATGLSAAFLIRRNTGGSSRYLAGQVSGYMTEDELFDDPFGYESEEIDFQITRYLPWNSILKLGAEAHWKQYVNRPALDLNGTAFTDGRLRQDQQSQLWLSISKTLAVFSKNDVNIYSDFYWLNNNSNDFYYDYNLIMISFGLALTF